MRRRRQRVATGRERLAAGLIDMAVLAPPYFAAVALGRRLGITREVEGERELGPEPEFDADDPGAFWAELRRRREALRGRPVRLVGRDGKPLPYDRVLLRAGDALSVALLAANDLRRPALLPGRRLVGLEVARVDGRPLRPRDAVVHHAVPVLVGEVARRVGRGRVRVGLGVAALSVALQLLAPEHRTLGDLVAGTRLVRSSASPSMSPMRAR